MPTHTKTDGTIEHRSEDGLRHCVEGPAVTRADGSQEWWLNGQPQKFPKKGGTTKIHLKAGENESKNQITTEPTKMTEPARETNAIVFSQT